VSFSNPLINSTYSALGAEQGSESTSHSHEDVQEENESARYVKNVSRTSGDLKLNITPFKIKMKVLLLPPIY
tara:strand:- start:7060 stop:7275 length:216 start_codon:yes stop_codon:yes gene_type:complete